MTTTNEEQDHFINTAAAIFAWISSADGEVSEHETTGFKKYLNELDFIDEKSNQKFTDKYLSFLKKFHEDFDEAIRSSKNQIKNFMNNETESEALLRVARKAIIADEKFHDVEENVILLIAKLLNIDESKIK